MSAPLVVADAPAAWAAVDVAQPPLGGSAGARFTQWDALRSPAGDTLVRGCVETPIPGWVADMRTAVEARGNALAMAAAERTSGAPTERRDVDGRSLLRTMGAPESAPPIGAVKTFLGFDDHAVATCFAVCTSRSARPDASSESGDAGGARGGACESVVAAAHLMGGTSPPSPGIVVGSVTWAVHHPVRTASASVVGAVVLGVLAVVLRRKPRSRIQ